MGSVLLVTTVGLLEPCLEAEVSSAIKMASKGAFVLSFVGITTAEKNSLLEGVVCHSADIRNAFKSICSKIQTCAISLPPMTISWLVGQYTSFLGVFTHLGSTWQEEVSVLGRKKET
jgi:hypothetical protein